MIIGIDPSLTGTGYAYRTADGFVARSLAQKEGRGMRRLDAICTTVVCNALTAQARLAVFEGYAFGFNKGASRQHSLGEVGGILKYALWSRGIDLMIVPPNSLKLFILGPYSTVKLTPEGKKVKIQVKQLVHDTVNEHAGIRLANNDQADAYVLMLMGEARLNSRLLPRVKNHYKHRAMDGCEYIVGKKQA